MSRTGCKATYFGYITNNATVTAMHYLLTIYRLVTVSGQILRLVNDTTLPRVVPTIIAAGHTVTIPPQSFGFVVVPDAQAAACLS